MSKRYEVDIECPVCGKEQQVQLFRTLWVEDPENRAMIFEDRMHDMKCQACDEVTHIVTSFMVTNVERNFAVWFEPRPDPDIDQEAAGYGVIFGPDSFYAQAPRISDWEEFKATIEKFERGELVGNPPTQRDIGALIEMMRGQAGQAESPRRKGFFSRLFGRG